MKVYFISGLGGDSRVFQFIELPAGYEKVCVEWIPHKKTESLGDYAIRLAEKIDKSEPFILAGLSMGGMIAVEIAKRYPPVLTILMSSVPLHSHFPQKLRWMHALQLHRIVPVTLYKTASLIKRSFSNEQKEVKELLKELIRDSDPAFLRWALKAILEWKNEWLPSPLLHIHGTRDEILPLKYTQPTHLVDNGKHLMVLSKSEVINTLLVQILEGGEIKPV
jgi:pimeloyl-ACP methyl ester carboxylesterase